MKNKIVVLVRTRDEEKRIGLFCQAYKDADRILVADGGSVDQTKQIAAQFPNVVIRDYPGRVPMRDGTWRNNDSDHVNWLIDWSKEYKPSWVILDDCDCRPNFLLKQDYRKLLYYTREDYVMVTRIYHWGYDQHFPHLAKPCATHDRWEPSLWAWRGNQDFKTVDVPPAFTFRIGERDIHDLHTDASTPDLFPPYALLHYSWPDPEFVQKKIDNYRKSGLIPGMLHPLEFGGPLAPLEWWMRE